MADTTTMVMDAPAARHGWSSLLERFYSRAGAPAPSLTRLPGPEVPEPYHRLLVHSADMTPTLENFFGRRLGLRVVSRERKGDLYYREVVLFLQPSRRSVEYGVIRIYLDHLPAAAKAAVLEERSPLGDVLRREQIPHLGWPQAYFRVAADRRMMTLLELPEPADLYGRRNVLLDGQRRLLAEVIEVLPVLKSASPVTLENQIE